MKHNYILSIVLTFTCLAANAQDKSQGTVVLSLTDCLGIAENNSSDLKNAELDVKAARLQKQEALAEYFPRVSASAMSYYSVRPLLEIGLVDILGSNDFTWNLQEKLDELGEAYGIKISYSGMKWGYAGSVTIMQPIFAGGRIINGNRLAGLGIEAADLQQSIQERKSGEDIRNLWWDITSYEDKFKMLSTVKTDLQRLDRQLKGAISSGLAGAADSLSLNIKIKEVDAGLNKLERGIRLQKMNLLNTIGFDFTIYSHEADSEKPHIDSILFKTDSDMEILSPEHYFRDEEYIVSNMDENRLLQLQIDAKRLEKDMAIGEALPQVGIGAMGGYTYLNDKGKYNAIAFASVQIPISDWGKTARKAQRLDTQIQKARNQKDFLERQLHLQVGKLWLDLTSSYDDLMIAEDIESNAQRLYNVSMANLNAGLASMQDVIQAETEYLDASSKRIEALITYRKAIFAYTSLFIKQ